MNCCCCCCCCHPIPVCCLRKNISLDTFVRTLHPGLPPPDADLPTSPANDVLTPSTVAEAESSEHAAVWRDSRTREFRGLLQGNTFGLTLQPFGNVIDPKRLFSWKLDEFGWISKAKSTLVARGFKQREGIDFGETFAPTVSSSCVRSLSAIACELGLDVCHFDVEQAFVQSKLDEDVFLRLSRGCARLSGKIVRLNKILYGLKQASRSWHAHLTTCLKTLGFQQCLADACVFRLVEEGRVAIIAVVHVDDIFAVGLKIRYDVFQDELDRMVPVKNLGELRWYGGCHYTREREMGSLTISQKTFADELVKKFCLTFTQSVSL